MLLFLGETTQVHTVCQVIPDARRSEISHVRAQRIVAFQVSHLQQRIQQTHESEKSLVPAHR